MRCGVRDRPNQVLVTDLPFGKRVGTPMSVEVLIPLVLDEMARVCRCGSGRAVFLINKCKPLEDVRANRNAAG